MEKVKIGVVGIGRGESMIRYCEQAENAVLVAVCDQWEEGLKKMEEKLKDPHMAYYTSFEAFLEHDMDAVVLANYANEHAPFAIKAMESGKHVISEVLPVQSMKEAVELVETAERTKKIYAYAENYCFMPAPREMKRLYRQGKIGEFEYGEGEYAHNCEPIWPRITHGDPRHWRNRFCYANFYCTHSIGPLIHITGLRPVKVSGFELPFRNRCARMGKKTGLAGIEMITLENGAVIKSLHGDLDKNSIWYSVYGSKGRMESAREDAEHGDVNRIYLNLDKTEGQYDWNVVSYQPKDDQTESAKEFGHGGSDFYTMFHFIEKVQGNHEADTIDVYEALDMFLPGMFAYRSVLNGGIPMEIPNLRIKDVREQYRNDTMCVDPAAAGDQLIPAYSKGEIDIPDEIYEGIRQKWLEQEKQ